MNKVQAHLEALVRLPKSKGGGGGDMRVVSFSLR